MIDEAEYNYLMDGSGIEGDEAEDGYFGLFESFDFGGKVVADRLRSLDLEAERTQLRKAIKPKQVVAADGSVSYKRPSLASLKRIQSV